MGLGLTANATEPAPERQKAVWRENRDWIQELQGKRAAGTLGMSEGQIDNAVAQGMGTAGAATQSMLAQMPASGDQAQQQALMRTAAGGLQNTSAQLKQGADLASQQMAANQTAEINAQEQALFARRAKNRDFALDALGKAGEVAGRIVTATCWVAVALWGECERTQMARLHCRLSSGPFYSAYRTHGKVWASWLNAHPWAKPLVTPIWRYLAWQGQRRFDNAVQHAKQVTHG
jgi:hypothetical protein